MLGSLELVVAGYNHRWLFGVVFALLALWPALKTPPSRALATNWAGACLLIAGFPLLPTEQRDHTVLVVLGGPVVALVALKFERSAWLWALPLSGSLIVVPVTMSFLSSKVKPPAAVTLLNWTLAPTAVSIARPSKAALSPRE